MKNSYYLLLLLLSCLTCNSFAAGIWKLQNVEYRVDTLSHVVIGPGTTQTTLSLEGPVKLRLFYTTTDLTDPNVNLKLISGKDNLTNKVTVPNMPASHGDTENIYFAGVNADFFSGTAPIGTTVSNGELYKSYKGTGWYAFGIDKDKKLYSGAPYTTFRLLSPNAGQASIKAVNAVRSENELILYTSRKGSSTGTKGAGVEVGAVPVDGVLKAEGTTKMRVTVTPVKDVGNMPIPKDGFVLSGTGFTTSTLLQMQLGEVFEVTPTIFFNDKAQTNITEMCGGCPMLLHEGKILETQGLLDHLVNREPRTAIGYDADGTKAVLLVVDGRKPGVSVGVTSKDLAAILLNLGCAEALNFDGGGSSTMYVKELGVLNTPSDGTPRAVANGLFITAPATGDNTIAKIRFADYAKQIKYNSSYSPVIFGYNEQGVLVDTNVKGIILSCDSKLGKVQEDGSTLLCDGAGTHTLTASLGDLTSTLLVTVTDSPVSGITSYDTDKSASIYPNPIRVGERAYIKSNGNAEVRIYNVTGRLMSNIKYENNGSAPVVLPTESLSPGFYIVSISDKMADKTAKLMIKSR